ncbi:DNA methyltransferase [Dehalococcoides mccartyi]|uniref:DNA methyltransferase n=2 Tax=Dehalococcoides mccartyi TaxID=61435 RepID=UPI000B1740B5|nr:site-specific DNA-methyltransferase [Dehalococcoides mccartyi]
MGKGKDEKHMQNLLDELTKTLKMDNRLVIEGKLAKNKIVELALGLDKSLIRLLLKNEAIKKQFFIEVDGVQVFDKIEFQRFVSNKQFLPDCYTAFKNKIGLSNNGEYLNESREVVLDWPYKDCVLEGSQTQEDQKRNEIFWNETLAPDEIDRLLSPKALKNFRLYSKEGVTPLISHKQSPNLLLKGNNLLSMHSLKKSYANSIKLIYIDPPYNTGTNSFGYNDSFNHSAWLTFLKNRLEIAKDLLSTYGSIWINLDDVEAHYAKVLCDEVFDRGNFVANVIWQKKYAPQNDAKFFSDNHDHILVYAKNIKDFKLNLLPRSQEMNDRYHNPDNDSRGPWASDNLLVKTYAAEYDYPITNPAGKVINPPNGSCWRVSKERFEELKADNRIWFGDDGKNVPRLKRFLSEVKEGTTPLTIWPYTEVGHNQDARRELFALVDTNIFKTPKPEKLVKRIIELGSNENDYVMDFCAGSGTTAAVAMKMGRKFIVCEQMDYCETVTIERLKKVMDGEEGGISKEVNWKGGSSFIYCELAKFNQTLIDRINKADDPKSIREAAKQVMKTGIVDYRISVSDLDVDDFNKLSIEDQRKLLISILDKNALYIPFSEIEDQDYGFSKAEKELNYAFYNLRDI